MPSFQSIDPRSGEPLRAYPPTSEAELRRALDLSAAAGRGFGLLPPAARLAWLTRLADALTAEAPRLGALATEEMGKPLTQAVKEVEKCASACRYYAEHAEAMLRDAPAATGALRSYVTFRPLGPVLLIMPWNFPYWQVIRVAAPAVAAGNTVLLKHAENTTGVALELERLFAGAGFPAGVFQVLRVGHDALQAVIADPLVRAVSLTGSERAGAAVASHAGAHLKKTVLELGGSDAYVVLRDADVERAARICVDARLINNGQSCVAAKRFIVEAPVYDRFLEAFVAAAAAKRVGDPMAAGTDVGPLAKAAIRDGVESQVARTVALGARAVLGGGRGAGPGWWYDVTVLDGVTPGMPAFDEEVFGPVAALVRARDEDDALALANRSRFGLGGAIFSRDVARAETLAARHLDAGITVVNGMVQSDPRLPFGGVKMSGYGRELADYGLKEFVNVKSVVVNAQA